MNEQDSNKRRAALAAMSYLKDGIVLGVGTGSTVNPSACFCIVVMPDTQNYAAQRNGGTKEMMIAQTEWSINNRVSRNVAYVTQLGDIVNNGDTPSYISQY